MGCRYPLLLNENYWEFIFFRDPKQEESHCGSYGGGGGKLIGVIDANHSGGDQASASKTAYSYYPDGNLKSETDPTGNRILYTYYAGGWLKDKRFDTDGDGVPSEADQMLLHFSYYPDQQFSVKYSTL
jgi:YD repeat-containing protein